MEGEADKYLMIGSDDDFPMMEVFDEGEAYLREHPECATALAALVSLNLKQDDLIQPLSRRANELAARSPLPYLGWVIAMMSTSWDAEFQQRRTRLHRLERRSRSFPTLSACRDFRFTIWSPTNR